MHLTDANVERLDALDKKVDRLIECIYILTQAVNACMNAQSAIINTGIDKLKEDVDAKSNRLSGR